MSEAKPDSQEKASGLIEIITSIRGIVASEGRLPPERDLAARLGVKRHQLRRGLKVLRDAGEMSASRLQRRTTGSRTTSDDLVNHTNPLEIVELRMMMEPVLARLAALRATANEIKAMEKMVEKIARGNPGAPSSADLRRMIAEASGNALAVELHALLRRIEEDTQLNPTVADRKSADGDWSEHEAVVAAIAGRSPDTAEEAMRSHLAGMRKRALAGAD